MAAISWVLVLIAWNGTLATVPGYSSLEECQSAGQYWRVAGADVSAPRYACIRGPEHR